MHPIRPNRQRSRSSRRIDVASRRRQLLRRVGTFQRLEPRTLLAAGIIELGPSDNIALDQPRVAVELAKDVDPGPGVVWESIGPGLFNTFLLDTGASSVLAMANAVADMKQSPQGYDIQGSLLEGGVAGDHLLDVSAPYRFDFAGSNGQRYTLTDARIMSDAHNDFSPFGPWGLAGMPAMEGRVTALDFTGWSGGGTSNLDDLYMNTEFMTDVPASNGHRYTLSVDNRIAFDPVDQMISGDPPVWGDVPFVTATVEHENVGQAGNFLFDTGAQISVISERLAIDIGLDSNGDGELDANDTNYVTHQVVGGVGGQIGVPVFGFDEVHFTTDTGEELVYTNLEWLVLDIDLPNLGASLDGVIGSDLLTSGWFHAFFAPGQPDGYINQIYMDFREMETNGTGKIHLDLNPDVDNLIPPGPGILIRQSFRTTDVGEGGVTDSYNIVLTAEPTHDVTITVAGVDGQITAENLDDGTNELVFTPDNWDEVQTVLVKADDDLLAEGNHTSAVTHSVTSTDPGYHNRPMPDVHVRITDNDLDLIQISSDSQGNNLIETIEAAEGGGEVEYWVALTSHAAPQSGTETWVLFEDTTGQSTAVKDNPEPLFENILIFTGGNWDTPQRVRLTATDDVLDEGPHSTIMVHTVLDPADFTDPIIGQTGLPVNITDNDLGDIVITPSDAATEVAEAGATDSYQIAPNLPPTGTVQIDVTADAQTRVSTDGIHFSPSVQLSFDDTVAKTVYVQAFDDSVVEDTHFGQITHAVSGTINDTRYPADLLIDSVPVTISDNDTAGLTITTDNPNESAGESYRAPAGYASEPAGTTIDLQEGQAASSYWVVLNSQPEADVTVFLTNEDEQAVAVDAENPENSFLTFDSQNWQTPQEVNVSAVDDFDLEGDHTTQIGHNAFSADANYQGSMMLESSITDNDGISIADSEVTEGHSGTTTLSFDVTIAPPAGNPVSVDVTVTDSTASALQIERVASGFFKPIFATHAPGQPDLLYVVEQTGKIKILDLQTGQVDHQSPFLTVTGLTAGGEKGLLGLAFHPDYENNGLFYVYMTDAGEDTLIRRYQVNPDGMTADPNSATPVMWFSQPYPNHNGGWIGFGPDDYLYIASGDGGSANDPRQNSQDITDNLLGKILRIDVDGDDFPQDAVQNYAIPPENPFADEGVTGDGEIFVYGLRNPWRSSFDRLTGDLYIGDVGQNSREEIDVVPAGSPGGLNFGWRAREGTISNPSRTDPDPPGAIDPIYDYLHGSGDTKGFSVTGGYVYRGPIPELRGQYFFADYVSERIWSLRYNGDDPASFDGTNYTDFTIWTDILEPDVGTIDKVSSFGEDAAGNLYIVELTGGEIFRFTAGADYLVASETLTFVTGQTSQTFEVEILGDRYAEEHETLVATLSNVSGTMIADGSANGTITNDDAPQVFDVAVNAEDAQRSVLNDYSLTFDSQITLDESGGDAFEIINRDTLETVNHSKTLTNEDGRTTVSFQFLAGPSVDPRVLTPNSLADGNYQVNAIASRISVGGMQLDGDGNGSQGGDYSHGTLANDEFFRFFADTDGDRDVDTGDLIAFGQSFRSTSAMPNYNPLLDFDGDGDVDSGDLIAFAQRFRQVLSF